LSSNFFWCGGEKFSEEIKQETLIIANDQMKAHIPHTIVRNTDFH
jgi:hypothetical protein